MDSFQTNKSLNPSIYNILSLTQLYFHPLFSKIVNQEQSFLKLHSSLDGHTHMDPRTLSESHIRNNNEGSLILYFSLRNFLDIRHACLYDNRSCPGLENKLKRVKILYTSEFHSIAQHVPILLLSF